METVHPLDGVNEMVNQPSKYRVRYNVRIDAKMHEALKVLRAKNPASRAGIDDRIRSAVEKEITKILEQYFEVDATSKGRV